MADLTGPTVHADSLASPLGRLPICPASHSLADDRPVRSAGISRTHSVNRLISLSLTKENAFVGQHNESGQPVAEDGSPGRSRAPIVVQSLNGAGSRFNTEVGLCVGDQLYLNVMKS